MVLVVSYISNIFLYNVNWLFRLVNVCKLKCNKILVSIVVVSECGIMCIRWVKSFVML